MTGGGRLGVLAAVALLAACDSTILTNGGDLGDGGAPPTDAAGGGPGGQQDGPVAQDGPAGQSDALVIVLPGQDAAAGQHDAAPQQDSGSASCTPAKTPSSSSMNAGQACLGCHGSWSIGGTLYSAASGGSAVGGATIHVVDSTGHAIDLVTGSDGNFYTSTSLSPPYTVTASKCPNTQQMSSAASSGDCNQSGCHTSGNRIHLP